MIPLRCGDCDTLHPFIDSQTAKQSCNKIVSLFARRTHDRNGLHLNVAGWGGDRRKIGIGLRERKRDEKAQNNRCGPKADGKQAEYRGDLRLETSISSVRNENAG